MPRRHDPADSGGIVRYAMKNLGRHLVRIDFDSGRSLFLLADEIALEGERAGGM